MDRTTLDYASIGGGYLGAFAYYADLMTPILSALMLFLSVVWLLWRMVDRWRHGPRHKGAHDGD